MHARTQGEPGPPASGLVVVLLGGAGHHRWVVRHTRLRGHSRTEVLSSQATPTLSARLPAHE